MRRTRTIQTDPDSATAIADAPERRDDALLTRAEAAALLRISTTGLDAMVHDRVTPLRPLLAGRRFLFRREDLIRHCELLARRRFAAKPAAAARR